MHTLTGSVPIYYWYRQIMKNVGFIKNCTIEEIVENSFEKALKKPDDNVIHDEEHVGFNKVQSMSSPNVYYKVYGSNTQWACCTCKKAEMGDICKHQMKIFLLKNNSSI